MTYTMYQEECKLEYMKEKSETSKKVFSLFFSKIQPYEEMHNKSIHEFSLSETKELFKKISPKNSKQAKMYCGIVNGYRRFKCSNSEHLFSGADRDFFYQFDKH